MRRKVPQEILFLQPSFIESDAIARNTCVLTLYLSTDDCNLFRAAQSY